MAVIVEGLTKHYGTQTAVDNLSFRAEKGEILGFLGPNGAGKTTTMKILTGFLAQDDGSATIEGYDSRTDSLELRRLVGYLPENNPLYLEMYVREYLGFIAGIYHMKNKKEKIESIIAKTGLTKEAHKTIGSLSKGYRQRVGLAQALIHDPEVIILDEPTSGLDPNQLVEIRALIRELGKARTVIFSTHILQEVQAICDRVLIIHQGKLVLDKPIAFLDDFQGVQERITVRFSGPVELADIGDVEGVLGVEQLEDNAFAVRGEGGKELQERLFDFAVKRGLKIYEMQSERSSVEDIFQMLTKQDQA